MGSLSRSLAVLASLAACSRTPAPKDPTEHALFRDLEREVTVANAAGWGVDRFEIDELAEQALDSVCRVDVLGRRGLHDWLDAEISRRGGPVETAWRKRGKKLSKVSELLTLHRVRLLLTRADELSLDCPFWIEPENPFTGRQISESTWELSVGGAGNSSALQQGEHQDINFGGSVRLLFGRMFDNGDGLYTGVDFGASATVPKDANGNRSTVVIGADLVAPLVYRRTLVNTYWEYEAGWLGHSTEADWGDVDNGIHVGVAFGGRALRRRFLFPNASLAVAYERLFLPGDDLIMVKIAARVMFDIDL